MPFEKGHPKRGGRKAGVPNKATALPPEKKAALIATGQCPIEFLQSVWQSAKVPLELRIDAAKAVAPYFRPKLSTVTQRLVDDAGHPIAPTLILSGCEPSDDDVAAYLASRAKRTSVN